jgi:GNAT superfamily N-acetyltransferase
MRRTVAAPPRQLVDLGERGAWRRVPSQDVTHTHRGMNARELWMTYADHVARMFENAPLLRIERGPRWFAVLTCEQHTDVNQCVLTPGATPSDARNVVSVIAEREIPAVVSVASETDGDVHAVLADAGLRKERLPEPLMWCPTTASAGPPSFEVRRVVERAEYRLAVGICARGHSMEESLLTRVLERDPSGDERVSTWIAWDAEEPISVVWLTHGEHIGVWEMMTPPEHRRRGAARAALTAALAQAWAPSTQGAFLWASPAGRPLYESLGFHALDEPSIWVTPGSEAASLAVGQLG